MNDMYFRIAELINNIDFNKTFVFDDINNEKLSYNQFFEYCINFAEVIESTCKADSIVAIMENSVELAMLYFSVMLTDKKVLVIDPQKGKKEIQSTLESISDAKLIVDAKIELDSQYNSNILDFEKTKGVYISDVKNIVLESLSNRDFQAPYLVTYTSGTSGVTKGVVHSLANLIHTAYALQEKVEAKPESCLLHVMPMTYMAGILNSIIYPFIAGASIIITERFSIKTARIFWNKVIMYNANLFWLSPAMLMMIEQLDRGTSGEEYCASNEMTFLVGTAALTDKMRQKFNLRYGVEVFASYGLSETLFISVETKNTLKKKDSVGEILRGVEHKLTGEGELLLDVPWMYLEYTNEDKESYFEGEYYKSGDLARLEDGCLFITGRRKELIIKGGINISPVLIEECILKRAEIAECTVIGVKDKSGEEKICCVYVLGEMEEFPCEMEKMLRQDVTCELGKNYMIDYFWKVEKLTRNINGKIDKNQIRSVWENENG